MNTHSPRYLVKTILVIWLASLLRIAISATAIATITVTIMKPTPDTNYLMLSAMQLDMHGKTHDELTIINRSSKWREVFVELIPTTGSMAECDIRYSPMTSSIPPGGHQVLRVLFRENSDHPCTTDHRLLFSDRQMPGVWLFSVPIYTARELGREME